MAFVLELCHAVGTAQPRPQIYGPGLPASGVGGGSGAGTEGSPWRPLGAGVGSRGGQQARPQTLRRPPLAAPLEPAVSHQEALTPSYPVVPHHPGQRATENTACVALPPSSARGFCKPSLHFATLGATEGGVTTNPNSLSWTSLLAERPRTGLPSSNAQLPREILNVGSGNNEMDCWVP